MLICNGKDKINTINHSRYIKQVYCNSIWYFQSVNCRCKVTMWNKQNQSHTNVSRYNEIYRGPAQIAIITHWCTAVIIYDIYYFWYLGNIYAVMNSIS